MRVFLEVISFLPRPRVVVVPKGMGMGAGFCPVFPPVSGTMKTFISAGGLAKYSISH